MGSTLLLVRHAAADFGSNDSARLCGWFDVPLSALGQKQVGLLRQRLSTEPAAAVYTSPLRRAAETAAAAPAALGFQSLEELREIHCGEFEGKLVEEIETVHPELWQRNLAQEDENFRWPGGESYREFRDRAVAALDSIASRHAGERVIVVTHSGVINQIIGALKGLSPASWEPFRPSHASISEIEWNGGTACLTCFDDRSHLAPLAKS